MNNGDILTASFFNNIENNIENNNKILIIEINNPNNNDIATNKYTFTQINNLINNNYFIVFKLKTITNNGSTRVAKTTSSSSSLISTIVYNYFYIVENDNKSIQIATNISDITLLPDPETDYLIYESGGEQAQ